MNLDDSYSPRLSKGSRAAAPHQTFRTAAAYAVFEHTNEPVMRLLRIPSIYTFTEDLEDPKETLWNLFHLVGGAPSFWANGQMPPVHHVEILPDVPTPHICRQKKKNKERKKTKLRADKEI